MKLGDLLFTWNVITWFKLVHEMQVDEFAYFGDNK